VVVVAGSGLARYTEIALPLDKMPDLAQVTPLFASNWS